MLKNKLKKTYVWRCVLRHVLFGTEMNISRIK